MSYIDRKWLSVIIDVFGLENALMMKAPGEREPSRARFELGDPRQERDLRQGRDLRREKSETRDPRLEVRGSRSVIQSLFEAQN